MATNEQRGGRAGSWITNLPLGILLVCYWQANKHGIFGGSYGWDYGTVTFGSAADREALQQRLDEWGRGDDVRAKAGWRLVGPAGDDGDGGVVWITKRAVRG